MCLLQRQASLRRLPRYELTAAEVPRRRDALFLGMGFEWTAVHTQRLHLVQDPGHRRADLAGGFRRVERYVRSRGDTPLGRWLSRDAWWNPFPPLPAVGGNPVLHGIEIDEREMWMAIGERVGHMGVYGTTRVGKTRFAELVIIQDIARGDVVVVFDPKGDVALLKRVYAEAARSARPFYMFHLGYPEVSPRQRGAEADGRLLGGQVALDGEDAGQPREGALDVLRALRAIHAGDWDFKSR